MNRNLSRCLPYPLECAWIILTAATLTIVLPEADVKPTQTLNGIILMRLTFVCIAMFIILLHLKRVPRFRIDPISLFLVYGMFALLSSVWSTSFIGTLGKSVELMAATMVVWITMVFHDHQIRLLRLVNWTLVAAALLLSYAVVGLVLDFRNFTEPSRGLFPYLLQSPLVSANSIAQYGAFLGLFCLAKALTEHRDRWLFGLCYVICLTFPVAAQGRTGMVSAVVGSSLLFARRYPAQSLFAIPGTAIIANVLLGDTLWKLFLRGQDDELFYSLSGRTGLWEAGWKGFLERPLFGSGFGEGSKYVVFHLLDSSVAKMSSMHNGPLEVVLGVGLVGFAFWAYAVLSSARPAIVAYLRCDHLPIVSGIVVTVTSTFLSIGIGGWLDLNVQYYLAAVAFLWLRGRQPVKTLARRVPSSGLGAYGQGDFHNSRVTGPPISGRT